MIYATKNILITVLAICLFFPHVIYSQGIIEVEGSIVVSDDYSSNPLEGTIRFNSSKKNFEGWNGSFWVSLAGERSFGYVRDIDGNSYKTIKINDQVWMAENLRVRQFNDGRGISGVINGWDSVTFPARCSFENNEDLVDTYGYLYNWRAVDDGKLCPEGWDVPSDEEWLALAESIGGISTAGRKMKVIGTDYWSASIKIFATNESGFSGLPGGTRAQNGSFFSVNQEAHWWSASAVSSASAIFYSVSFQSNAAKRTFTSKNRALSVRCVKDSN